MSGGRPRARWLVAALALPMVAAGCAWTSGSAPRPPASEAARQVARADELYQQRQVEPALEAYAHVAATPARDPAHARALYGLARASVDPARARPDYRAAHAALDRLVSAYPEGERPPDALVWRAVLAQLIAQEDRAAAYEQRAARLEQEAKQLRSDVATRTTQSSRLRAELNAREAEATRLREEAARLRAALERLKRIDLDVERRR